MSALDEIKEGFQWLSLDANSIRIEAGFPDRPDSWLVSWSDGWRVKHENGAGEDLHFKTEKAACDYLWDRLREPLV